jgi:hypothetical protein
MFFPRAWDETAHTARCLSKYGLTPQYDWMADHFGGRNPKRDFQSYTNIIQSNGDIDAWKVGSIAYNISSSFITLNIPGGAHHIDLRADEGALDPQPVKDARVTEAFYINKWIQEYYTLNNVTQEVVSSE